MSLLVRAGLVVTGGAEEAFSGWVLCEAGLVSEVGLGAPPAADQTLNLPGCVAVPGLVNAHDHLYQQATRGYAPNAGLFEWLTTLYPVWARLDAEILSAAARAGLGRLLLSGCTLASDHHYVFPAGAPGLFDSLIAAARDLGIRFHACRGSMSLGQVQGGLPPDSLVEDHDAILADTEAMAARYHDPGRGSMCQVVVAPCSPFSVSLELMRESAALARRLGLRLHTHLAETADEERFCLERFGMRPLELMEELGWVGDDVWFAHCVHVSGAEARSLGASGTGVAHCPSSNMRLGSGACPVTELVAAGAPVGLGVDGCASNEDYSLAGEARQALLMARLRAAMQGAPNAAAAMDARGAWALATSGGARCLGRDDCGIIAPGLCADIALFRVDDLSRVGIADSLEALALAPPGRAEAVIVNGRLVVSEGRLLTADEDELASRLEAAAGSMREAAGVA